MNITAKICTSFHWVVFLHKLATLAWLCYKNNTELQIKSKHLKGGTLNSNYILHFRQQNAINVKPHGMRDIIIVLFAFTVCDKEI